jgi:phage-related minor tail protein
LSSFNEEVSEVSIDNSLLTLDIQSLAEQKTREESELNDLKERMASYRQQLEKLDADIRQLKDEDEVGFIRRNILPKGLGGAPPREEVVSAKAKRAKLNRETDRIKDQIEDSEKNSNASKGASRARTVILCWTDFPV